MTLPARLLNYVHITIPVSLHSYLVAHAGYEGGCNLSAIIWRVPLPATDRKFSLRQPKLRSLQNERMRLA